MTALIVVGVAVGMLLLIRTRPKVEPFDPRSSSANGTNGAVLLLEQYGASVSITSQAPKVDADERVFVIADRLNNSQRESLLEFIDAGGVAVVADPTSSLHGGPGLDGGAVAVPNSTTGGFDGVDDAAAQSNVAIGACTVGSLEDLRGVFSPDGVLFPTAPDEDRCFSDGSNAFVIVRHYGDGLVVGFGDNRIVTNQYLRFADNSGLVTSLLAPTRGSHVRIMLGTEAKPAVEDIGQGDETLLDIVRPGIWMALTQLALAFVVFCVARGVRPGRAVREPQPTPIAGSELVLATGNLMQRAHHFDRAGWLLRGELYRDLVAHYRLPRDVPVDRISDVAGRRSGVQPAEVYSVLQREVADAAGLVQLRTEIDSLRRRLIRAETPDTPAANTSGTNPERTPERV